MNTKSKLGIGAVLAVCGGLGMALGPVIGFTQLREPFSFFIGFAVGLIGGIGTVLAVSGLIEYRK